jgi:hypothetical protein
VNRIRVIDGSSNLYGRRLAVHLMMQDKVGLEFFSHVEMLKQLLRGRQYCSDNQNLILL